MIKTYTREEIESKVREIWSEDNVNIKVKIMDDDKKYFVLISLERMYEYVSCTFAKLEQLSIFFDTKNIDFENGSRSGGCDTCDYGSSYEVDISIR